MEFDLKAMLEDGTLDTEVARSIYMAAIQKEVLSKYNFPKEPGKDGYYRIYVKDISKKAGRRQLFARTLEELEQKVFAWEKSTNRKVKLTFREVFRMAMDDRLSRCTNQQKKLSIQNTITRNNSEYKRFFDGTAFENMLIDEIGKKDIEQAILGALKKYSLRQKGLGSLRALIRDTFSFAYHEEWIEQNPYDRVDFARFKDMLIDDVAIEDRAHSDEDIDRILEFLHERHATEPDYVPAYALEFQILTGFRRGEIPPLRWSDIQNGSIYVHREQVTVKAFEGKKEHDEIVDHTKTHKNRWFPINSALNALMDQLKDIHDRYYPQSEFIFPADSINGCITNNTVYQFYRRMCNKLGIKVSREFTKGTHAFRRTRITQIVNMSGGDLVLTAGLFGNSPGVIMKNYYTGFNMDTAKRILEESVENVG